MPDQLDELLKNIPLQSSDTPDEPLAVVSEDDVPRMAPPVTFTPPPVTFTPPPVAVQASAPDPSPAAPIGDVTGVVDQAIATHENTSETPPQPADTQQSKADAAAERPDRSDSLKRRHRESLDKVFGIPGIRWEVVQEVDLTGQLGEDGQQVKFATPFGNKGIRGWVIRNKANPDEMHTIGASALKIGINEYKVIDPLPKKPRGRKPAASDAPVGEVVS